MVTAALRPLRSQLRGVVKPLRPNVAEQRTQTTQQPPSKERSFIDVTAPPADVPAQPCMDSISSVSFKGSSDRASSPYAPLMSPTVIYPPLTRIPRVEEHVLVLGRSIMLECKFVAQSCRGAAQRWGVACTRARPSSPPRLPPLLPMRILPTIPPTHTSTEPEARATLYLD